MCMAPPKRGVCCGACCANSCGKALIADACQACQVLQSSSCLASKELTARVMPPMKTCGGIRPNQGPLAVTSMEAAFCTATARIMRPPPLHPAPRVLGCADGHSSILADTNAEACPGRSAPRVRGNNRQQQGTHLQSTIPSSSSRHAFQEGGHAVCSTGHRAHAVGQLLRPPSQPIRRSRAPRQLCLSA